MDNENVKKYLQIGGAILIVLGQVAVLISSGVSPTTYKGLSSECSAFLYSHDEFTPLPDGCRVELVYLMKRIKSCLKDIEKDENGNSDTNDLANDEELP